MKIPTPLPNLGESALILITSTHEARMLSVRDNSIEELSRFSAADTYEYPPPDGVLHQELRRLISQELKRIPADSFERIYVLSPRTVCEHVTAALPPHLRKKVAKNCEGNFISLHPLRILELISKDEPAQPPVIPMSAEAYKILHATDE